MRLARVIISRLGPAIGSRWPLDCTMVAAISRSARSTAATRCPATPATTSTFPPRATTSWASLRARTTGRAARCLAPRSKSRPSRRRRLHERHPPEEDEKRAAGETLGKELRRGLISTFL
eukprot:scaffold12872_cov93-Phaeocystis_antarctica.AAC.3